MKQRRTYTREFKLKVLRECENGKGKAQLSREHGLHPSLITKRKEEFRKDPENAFSGHGPWDKIASHFPIFLSVGWKMLL